MKLLQLTTAGAFLVLLVGCTAPTTTVPEAVVRSEATQVSRHASQDTTPAPSAAEPDKPTTHQKVYHLQHRLLPRWTHSSNGRFLKDLQSGALDHLKAVALEELGKAYSEQITVRAVPELDAALITFPKPAEPPECFHVLVMRRGEQFQYMTLEQTEDILSLGYMSVLGEWTAEGRHSNFGPRKYADAETFLVEMRERKNQAQK